MFHHSINLKTIFRSQAVVLCVASLTLFSSSNTYAYPPITGTTNISCIDNNNPPPMPPAPKEPEYKRGIGPSQFIWRSIPEPEPAPAEPIIPPDGECTIKIADTDYLAVVVEKEIINDEVKCIISGQEAGNQGVRGKPTLDSQVLPFQTINLAGASSHYRESVWMRPSAQDIYVNVVSGTLKWNIQLRNDGESCQVIGGEFCKDNSDYSPKKGCANQ